MSQPLRRGAYIGVFVGIHGWLIGLAIACLSAGRGDFLLEVGPIGFAVSFAMSALAVVLLEAVVQAFGRHAEFQLSLWGVLLLFVGVLILLCNHWFAPLVDADPELVEVFRSLGTVYRVSDVVPGLCLLGSAVCSLIAVRRMWRRAPDGGERGENVATRTA